MKRGSHRGARSAAVMADRIAITAFNSSQTEEAQHRDDDDHETNDVDNVVHLNLPVMAVCQ